MADEQTSTVAEDVSTSVSAEPVEETTTTETEEQQPDISEDPWDFGDDEEAPAEVPKETEETKTEETKEEKEDEKSLEEKALEEAFAEADKEKAEAEKETDLDKLDPKEMIAAQRNAQARLWAERNAKKAEIVKDFQFDDKPIAEVATRLEEINPQRYVELSQHAAHALVDSNPDAAFQRAYAVRMLQQNPQWDIRNAKLPTLDEFIAGTHRTQTATQEPTAPAPPSADLRSITADLDSTIEWDWRNPELDENFVDERELAMAKTIRALEAKASEGSTKDEEIAKLNEQLQKATTTQQTAEQQEIESELKVVVQQYRDDTEKKILPWILKTNGLEVSADDSPEVKAFKEQHQLLFKGTDYERANGYSSAFESFAYNESSVRNELETLTKRLVSAQVKEVQAKRAGNKAEMEKYHREAADEQLPLGTLLAQANKEFKAKFVAPYMALIGKLSPQLTEPIKEASKRVEVTSNGGTPPVKPQKKDYQTADDVWGGMVEDAEEEDRLRANA